MNTEIEKQLESTLSSLLIHSNLDQLLDILKVPPKNHPYNTRILLAIYPHLDRLGDKLSHFQGTFIEKLHLRQTIELYEDDLSRTLLEKYCPTNDKSLTKEEESLDSPCWSKL